MLKDMRAAVLLRAALFALAGLIAVPAAAAGNEARDWLRRMNTSVVERNYDGWFVHQVGGHTERLRIIHRMHDGLMRERLITTDGSGREFVRNGPEYLQYLPQMRSVVLETRGRSYAFLVALNGLSAESERYYHIAMGGTERLIGHDVQLIRVEPRDGLRFGYRFWLDRQTALPLKTQLVSRSGRVLEEISFESLRLPRSIPDDLLKPDVDTEGFKWRQRDTATHNPDVKVAFRPRNGALPAGFQVRIFNTQEEEARATGPRTRFIVSDGIAWVSVFVDQSGGDSRPEAGTSTGGGRADGVVVLGSLAIYVARPEGYKVTAMGEVPPATVRAIAEAFQPE